MSKQIVQVVKLLCVGYFLEIQIWWPLQMKTHRNVLLPITHAMSHGHPRTSESLMIAT